MVRTVAVDSQYFGVRRVIGRGDLWVSEYIVMYEGDPAYTVRIMEFRDDKVMHERNISPIPLKRGVARPVGRENGWSQWSPL